MFHALRQRVGVSALTRPTRRKPGLQVDIWSDTFVMFCIGGELIMSGWWDKRPSDWTMLVAGQIGAASGLGGGAFILIFRSPTLRPRMPVFLVVAGGVGFGGSIGSGATIPYSSIFRKLINSKDITDIERGMFNPLKGSFSCKDMSLANFTIGQAGASAAIVGGQVSKVRCRSLGIFSGQARDHFTSEFKWPKNVKEFGAAMLDLPQIQGGLGGGVTGFTGPMFYLGCN